MTNFSEWIPIIDQHLTLRPLMRSRDVYKLLYQGLMGLEHLVDSPAGFWDNLRQEYDQVAPDSGDPLCEPIRPDRGLVRVNLCPFKALHLELKKLNDVCLQTAAQSWGSHPELIAAWQAFLEQCHQGRWSGLDHAEALAFTALLEEHAYPPAHHSPQYEQAYHPAYRLAGTLALEAFDLHP